jgi:manganese transport protein
LLAFFAYHGSYDKFEKLIMFLVTVILFIYLYFLFQLNVPLPTVIVNSLVPSLNGKTYYYAEAVIGASIMPTYVILHSGLVYEKGWIHHHQKGLEELVEREDKHIASERVDSILSIFMGTILNIVVIASAAILINGKGVNSFLDIAAPFYDRLGNFGALLFAVSFACAGISAVITVGLGSVYSAFGFLGFEERIRRRRFRLAFVLWLIIASIASLSLPNQIQIMVFTQYMNGALLPFVIIPLVLLAKNENIMGKYKLGKTTIILAFATVVVTTSLFLLSIFQTLF